MEPHLPSEKEEHRDRGLSTRAKTIVLWILLVLMFISIYQLMAVPSPHARARTHEITQWLWILGVGVPVVGFFSWVKASTRPLANALTLPRAIIACRSGKSAACARDLEEKWREIESALTSELAAPLRVVRAFAVAQTTSVRDAGMIERVLAPIRERAGEFAWLGAEWPEMRAFLASQSL